jgi:hypothetical protein
MIRYGDFLLHNAAGALALPGVLVGALLTGIFSLATGWIMRNRLAELAEKTSFATTWLSTSLKRELNFAQDYFVTIHANLSGCRSHDFAAAGALIRQDYRPVPWVGKGGIRVLSEGSTQKTPE